MELLSQAEYARRRGVTRQAINKAVDAGRIQLRDDGKGKKGIDEAEADRALGVNAQRVLAGDDDPASPNGYAGRGPGDGGREEYREASTSSGLTKARTATEVYKARIAELEYNERIGRLRPIEQTEIGAQRCGEKVLRAVENIVGRAEELHARSVHEGPNGTRTVLRAVVRDLRIVIAREFERLASGELGDDSAEEEDAS